jgi:hypothetical protein
MAPRHLLSLVLAAGVFAAACGASAVPPAGLKPTPAMAYSPGETLIVATSLGGVITMDGNSAFEVPDQSATRYIYDQLVTFPYGDLTGVQPGPTAIIYQPEQLVAYSADLQGLSYDGANYLDLPRLMKR